MAGYRTRFGKWLTVFCAERGMWVGDLSEYLGVAPATLSLIISGRHPIPAFLRENIISSFGLSEKETQDMDKSIADTEAEAVVVFRDYKQYVSVQAEDKYEHTKVLLELMAKAVNNMTEDEVALYKQNLESIAERADVFYADCLRDVDLDSLEKDIKKRYAKRPDVANRITQYLRSKRD